MRRLEKTKGGPEKGQERHEGCRKEPDKCRLMILLKERNRTAEAIRATDKELQSPGLVDTKIMLRGMNDYDGFRLCRIDSVIDKIREQGNCDGVELKGLMADYVIEEDIIKLPKPEQRASAVL